MGHLWMEDRLASVKVTSPVLYIFTETAVSNLICYTFCTSSGMIDFMHRTGMSMYKVVIKWFPTERFSTSHNHKD